MRLFKRICINNYCPILQFHYIGLCYFRGHFSSSSSIGLSREGNALHTVASGLPLYPNDFTRWFCREITQSYCHCIGVMYDCCPSRQIKQHLNRKKRNYYVDALRLSLTSLCWISLWHNSGLQVLSGFVVACFTVFLSSCDKLFCVGLSRHYIAFVARVPLYSFMVYVQYRVSPTVLLYVMFSRIEMCLILILREVCVYSIICQPLLLDNYVVFTLDDITLLTVMR